MRHLIRRPKDPIPQEQTKNVIYKVTCKECSASYVGQTSQMLTSRIYRQRLALKNRDDEHSALAEHAIHTGHEINWSTVGIVKASPNQTEKLLIESLVYKIKKTV